MPQKFFDRPFVTPSFVLGIALVLGASVVSYTLYHIRALDNTLTSTGSATQIVKADHAKWRLSIYRNARQDMVPAAYTQVSKDAAAVQDYFVKAGIDAKNITSGTITSDQIYTSDANAPLNFNVHQELIVESDDVDKVSTLAQHISELVGKGVQVSPQQPEYYVSTLPELRVSLLGKAVADAKARAGEIAKSGGVSVGSLKSASSGVVQVMTPNSINIDDYGMYDTSTIEKQVMVTARAVFFVQ